MEIPHSKFKIDINSINAPLQRLIESVNDESVRYVDVELYCNSMLITLSSSCTAKAAFVTDGILINDNVNCSLNDDNTAIVVPIDKSVIENSRSGLMSVEVTVTDGEQNLTLPFAFKVKVKDSIVNNAGINSNSVGTIADIVKEIAAARGSFQNLNYRFNNNEQDIAKKENLSNKVSTVDFQNPSESNYPSIAALYNYHNNYVAPCYEDIENLGNDKVDKSTTLSGYGITDAYTKEQAKKIFGLNVSVVFDENNNPLNYTESNRISAGSFATGNKSIKTAFIAKNLRYIGSGAFANCSNLTDVYIDNPSELVTIDSGAIPSTAVIHYNSDFNDNKNLIVSLINLNSLLSKKYDSSNIEAGSGSLTVYTPAAVESNLVKSSTFRYQKTGNTANIFFSIVFNEGSISYLQFTGLPFIAKNESDQNRHIAATNKQTQVILYPVGSWLTLNFGGTKTFSQDETLNGVITMLVS